MLASRVMKGLEKSACQLDHRSAGLGRHFLAPTSGGLQALTDVSLDVRFLSTVVKALSPARAERPISYPTTSGEVRLDASSILKKKVTKACSEENALSGG